MSAAWRRAWAASPPLLFVAAGNVFIFACVVCLALVDHRLVTGQPVWLKPAKFAISVAIYAATLAWALGHVTGKRNSVRTIGHVTSVGLSAEIVLITLQAARGVASHFNTSGVFDRVVFGVMGLSIFAVWLAAVGTLVLTMRQPFADRAFGHALRLGLLLSILGASIGGYMVAPTTAQRLQMTRDRHMSVTEGAHAVGAPDDGPGAPGLGWSLKGGDLRAGHFFGLHALQALPLFAIWLGRLKRARRLGSRAKSGVVYVFASAWLSLTVLLFVQAVRGESLFSPSKSSILALSGIVAMSLVSALLVTRFSAEGPAGWRTRQPSQAGH